MARSIESLYEAFGVSQYHANGVYGQGVKMMVIDTGMERNATEMNHHGLAVASLLSPRESSQFRGIAPKAHVELCDVHDATSIPIDAVMDAIRRGIRQNVDIISISLGTSDAWGPMQDLITEATRNSILVFAAAGNSGERGYEFPAACVDAIAVASMNSSKQPSPFNTRNDAVVVFAPGEKIALPTGKSGQLEEHTGTSFATPFAAGVAALVLSDLRNKQQNPKLRLTRREMIDTLRNPAHFSLNCTDHSYVMEKTCTNFAAASDTERESLDPRASRALMLGFLLLMLLLLMSAALVYSVR